MPSITRRIAAIGALVAAMACAGCLQPSLHPLLTPSDSHFDAGLIGRWACGDQTWTFKADADEELFGAHEFYTVTISGKESIDQLAAWAGRLGASEFINFYPDSSSQKTTVFYSTHFAASHTFGRVRVEPERVRFDLLSDEWVANATASRRIDLGQPLWPDQRILLTASTPALQRFAREFADDWQAFGEHFDCHRSER